MLVKISDVCKDFGLTTRTLRYYEEIGLIKSSRSETYSYRLYDEANLQRIREIVVLRKLDISIKNILLIFNEQDNGLLAGIIREKLLEIEEQSESMAELRNLLSAFLNNIENNKSILDGMKLAETVVENDPGNEDKPEENQFDFTRFIDLCNKMGHQKDFAVIKLGALNFDYSNNQDMEHLRAECGEDGYFVFNSEHNCFGIAMPALPKGAAEDYYAVTVVQGENDLQQALLAFGDWLKSGMYSRAAEAHFCLLKEIGDVETNDGVMPQLAVYFPIKPYFQREHSIENNLHPSVMINKLTEGFKMFKSTLTGQDIRPFAEAVPFAELTCYALPELRVIGKCMELELDFKVNPLPEMWDNMFKNGDFEQLDKLSKYRSDIYVGLSDMKNSDSGKFVYYAGVLSPKGTTPPAGFAYVDLSSTLAVLGRYGENVKKVQRGIKKMGLEKGYGQGAGTAWDMEVYFDKECNGPAAGKNYGANSWRILVPAFKKVENN